VVSADRLTLDRVNISGTGFVPSETQILDAVRALHEDGNDTVTVAMILNHFEPGFTAKVAATAKTTNVFDAVGPSINNVLAKAGREGTLTVDTADDGLVTVRFPATTGS
jgi:hypothetical protein